MLKSFSNFSQRQLNNLTRKSEKYGNVHFISFYCAVLSRLAYFSDEYFLDKYTSIFGPIIDENIMKCINESSIPDLLEDEKIFKLNDGNPYNFSTYTHKGKLFVDFIELTKKVNVENNEIIDKKLLEELEKINHLKRDLPNIYNSINSHVPKKIVTSNPDIVPITLDDVKEVLNSNDGLHEEEKLNLIKKLEKIITKGGFTAFRKSYILSVIDKEYRKQKVKYISIATSNYGEIYVVADKRMPSTIFLIFRGTYSAKTAAAYTKPTSLIPLNIGIDDKGNSESYLFGIFKITIEIIHTIVESLRYLSVNFLNKDPGSVKIITTGHSLGGAMATNFAYLWMKIRKTPPYNSPPYNILSEEIGCFSLGAPRSINTGISEMFCNYVLAKKITYLRIITKGDPVPLLPFKATYFSHPCEDNISIKKIEGRSDVDEFEKCNSLIKMIPNPLTMKVYPRVNYEGNLDCLGYNTRVNISNPLSHTIYLDILFVNAVDIKNFASSAVSFTTKEITRNPKTKSTTCRVILYDDEYKAAFFDMTDATGEFVDDLKAENALLNEKSAEAPPQSTEEQDNEKSEQNSDPPKEVDNNDTTTKPDKNQLGGGDSGYGVLKSKTVVEDINVNKISFNNLIENAVKIEVSPLPMYGELQNPFKDVIKEQQSPKLCCIGLKQKGGKTRKNRRYKTKPKTRKIKPKTRKNHFKTRKNKYKIKSKTRKY